MDTLLRIGLSNAITATALALVAAVLSRAFRRPALTHILWVIVLIKLISPPLFALPVHLGRSPPGGGEVIPQALSAQNAVGAPTPIRLPSAGLSLLRVVSLAAVGAWVSGALVAAGIAGVRLRRFAKLLRFATPAPADVQRQCRELAARMGLGDGPPVYFLPGRLGPMLWAPLSRQRLLIPAELWERLSLGQRATLLLHELAHLRRWDHWVRALELVVLTLFWWHPVAWWARHELREAEEQCCDAWVTWALPAGHQDYASALVEAVEFVSVPNCITGPVLPALASGIGEFRHLKRRLVMIQQGNSNRTLGKTGIFCACAAAALLPLTISRAQPPSRPGSLATADRPTTRPTTEPAMDPALRQRLNRTLPQLHFDGIGLSDVLEFLQDVSGVKFQIDWKGMEAAGVGRNTPVTLNMQRVKLSEAISAVLENAAKPGVLTWRPSGKMVQVGAAEKKSPHEH